MLKPATAILTSIMVTCLVVVAQSGEAAAQQTIRIGGLVLDDLSSFNDVGREKAIDYVVANFNAEQAALNSDYRLEYTPVPVSFNAPGLADEDQQIYKAVRDAYHSGIKYFVGPSASSLAITAKAFTDTTADAVLVSPSSTAPVLAIPGDSLFRLTHDDRAQAPKLVDLMQRDGKEHIVFIQRTDIWGEGLYNAISALHAGSEVLITMDPAENPNTTQSYYDVIAADLLDSVNTLSAQYGKDKVAVVLILFDVDTSNLVDSLFRTGHAEMLSTVKWYGTDGIAGNANLIADETVADFLATVRLVGTIFQVEENPINRELTEHVSQFPALDFTYRDSVHDAAYLLADSVIVASELSTPTQEVLVRDVVWDVANDNMSHPYHSADRSTGAGALGAYTLNEAGDLMEPDTYELLKIVVGAGGTYDWISISSAGCR